ncbi:MAG: MATE family efflux transporter, partial [Peptococcaceae bacterium]|nr:MATE family efflux transporter [Peptococcaceae bacterium]
HGFHIYSISFLFVGFSIFGSSFFTALNNGLVSAIISFVRTLIFEVAAVLVLPALWGIDGIGWAVVIARGLSIVLTFAFILANRKKYQY